MASWDGSAAISTFLTLKDIAGASSTHPNEQTHETPVLKLGADARSKRYDAICMPLTTDEWKRRWTEMCLLPTGSERETEVRAEQMAERWRSRPCFLKDEVTLTRLGGCLT